jgi:mannosyltransferase
VPVLHHYLRDVPGLRYATLWGPVADLGVTDWRDGAERLEATSPERDLAPLLDDVPVGGRAVLITPEFYRLERWQAPWTALVRRRTTAWEAAMLADRRFRVVAVEPDPPLPVHPNPLRATVLVRVGLR